MLVWPLSYHKLPSTSGSTAVLSRKVRRRCTGSSYKMLVARLSQKQNPFGSWGNRAVHHTEPAYHVLDTYCGPGELLLFARDRLGNALGRYAQLVGRMPRRLEDGGCCGGLRRRRRPKQNPRLKARVKGQFETNAGLERTVIPTGGPPSAGRSGGISASYSVPPGSLHSGRRGDLRSG